MIDPKVAKNIIEANRKIDEYSDKDSELELEEFNFKEERQEYLNKIKEIDKKLEENKKKIDKNNKDKLMMADLYLNYDVRMSIIEAYKKQKVPRATINKLEKLNEDIENKGFCFEALEQFIEYCNKLVIDKYNSNNVKKKNSFLGIIKDEFYKGWC